MTHIRRARVVDLRVHPGRFDLLVEIDGNAARAVAYPSLTGPVEAGDTVIVNTTAVDLRLGTGGAHLVMAVEGRERVDSTLAGHTMKLRYSPVQSAVACVEETHRDQIDAVDSLAGARIVVAGLHSALAPAVLGIRDERPDARIAYVMTDAGALHIGFSDVVLDLRAAGLIDTTITCGQSTGGDLEAVTIYGALAAAIAVTGADVVVVSMGPGNLGTGSRWGAAALEVAQIANAVLGMGGTPLVIPRVSFADTRDRHRGVSHHTRTALTLMLGRVQIALPPMRADADTTIREHLGDTHEILTQPLSDALEATLVTSPLLQSMGRHFAEDPEYFRVAAAGGARAARLT